MGLGDVKTKIMFKNSISCDIFIVLKYLHFHHIGLNSEKVFLLNDGNKRGSVRYY